MNLELSLIIPLYNRPDEIRELLESLCLQSDSAFEVIIVEDGSSLKSDAIVDSFKDRLKLAYYFKPNSGPGQSRNYGAERAQGNYFIFLDSDCIIPADYIQSVKSFLAAKPVDAFGGPDRADASFSPIQKAINYSMTALFTTGGIRGGKHSVEKFHPRSFNMGYTKEVFERTGGFAPMRFGEDIDMSIRMMKEGFSTALIPDAYVYHKRRSTFRQFYKQVHNSGIARINLYKRHPESLKLLHFFPASFSLFVIFSLLLMPWTLFPLSFLGFYFLLIFLDALRQNKSIFVAILAMLASFIQLFSYGLGFMKAVYRRLILGRGEFAAFEKNFYK
ncbi:glycosyltransferase [Croceimicrobium hydrocarbonivorans]|uniref:Glycosyltransferase n=1 Tax=Croceimicrobium hydrocarbonivorans TaxID=2761580 RepID=A0A7H0VE59_9FLAO|nr:glycosyltransferase [Croceimicrobium hydrocarbonivorans]QNR24007.1 glycosyltransferase [Croceimicrobium hydrocarbonivorans]